ncbi:hypothetical protein Acsp06_07270 [Actinomycetospora sp. NBRC 106375]|nr:hypothetical protein Acsp06_07270 [Actinomycetospora sp. NBRC 106375]
MRGDPIHARRHRWPPWGRRRTQKAGSYASGSFTDCPDRAPDGPILIGLVDRSSDIRVNNA